MIAGNSLGIDYHSESLQVSIIASSGEKLGSRKCPNSVEEMVRYVEPFGEVKGGAVEVSCGAAAFVDEVRTRTGWDIKLCHPGFVNRMKNNPDKSDKTDGDLLGDLHRVGYLPEVWLAPLHLRDLKQLIRLRCQDVDYQTQLKLRIRAIFRHFRVPLPERFSFKAGWSKQWLKDNLGALPKQTQWVVEQQLQRLENTQRQIKESEKRLLEWAQNDSYTAWLMTKRGIGLVTSSLLRAEIGTVSRFRRSKQFARFCGMTPRNNSTGKRMADSGLINAGCAQLKKAIVQVSHILRRVDPKWWEMAVRLKKEGKHTNVITAAIGNRWLRVLYHEMCQFEQTLAPAA